MIMRKWFAIVTLSMRICVHKYKMELLQNQREVRIMSNIYDNAFAKILRYRWFDRVLNASLNLFLKMKLTHFFVRENCGNPLEVNLYFLLIN